LSEKIILKEVKNLNKVLKMLVVDLKIFVLKVIIIFSLGKNKKCLENILYKFEIILRK